MSDIVNRLREVAEIETGLLYSRRQMLNDAADEIIRLRVKLADQLAGHQLSAKHSTQNLLRATKAEAERDPLKALCDEMAKALEPFAKAGQVIDGPFGPALFVEDDTAFKSGCAWSENGVRRTITWGDFRRASAAYRKEKEVGNG